MPCYNSLNPGQTVSQRAEEVRTSTKKIDRLLADKKVQVKIGPQGAVAFLNVPEDARNRMTDGCIYRQITRTGSAAAKMAIARAEQLAGRTVDRKVVAQGVHSHDAGRTWHPRG